jgi:hypothetical protein
VVQKCMFLLLVHESLFLFPANSGLDINICLIPVKTDVGQVDLVLQLSDGTSEKIRFPNVPVRRTNDKFKFGAKLISDNFYMSVPE